MSSKLAKTRQARPLAVQEQPLAVRQPLVLPEVPKPQAVEVEDLSSPWADSVDATLDALERGLVSAEFGLWFTGAIAAVSAVTTFCLLVAVHNQASQIRTLQQQVDARDFSIRLLQEKVGR